MKVPVLPHLHLLLLLRTIEILETIEFRAKFWREIKKMDGGSFLLEMGMIERSSKKMDGGQFLLEMGSSIFMIQSSIHTKYAMENVNLTFILNIDENFINYSLI